MRYACVFLLLLATPVLAQVSASDSLSLETATARALAANPDIAAARLRSAIHVAGIAVAGERPNPEAAFEIAKETPKQSFGVAVPLELGGKRQKRLAVGEATLRAGEAELAATIAQVRNAVRRAYYDVVVAESRLRIQQDLLGIGQRVRGAAQARFDAGDAPRLEVLQADLALATAENEVTATTGAAAAARARLNALLRQPLDATPSLSSPLDAGAALTLDGALEMARSSSVELAVLDRQIEEQRARVALAESLRIPDLIPSATLTHDAQPEFTYGWRAALSVTLPLFTTHKAGVLVEETTLGQLIAAREAAWLRINGEVVAATANADAMRQAFRRYRDDILPQAQQVEQLAQDSYQLGQSGLAALLLALQATTDVRLRSLDTLTQFQAALAELERAIGAPLP